MICFGFSPGPPLVLVLLLMTVVRCARVNDRNVVMAHKMVMEPHKESFCVPLRHWRTSHAAPVFRITPRRSTADVIALDIVCFTALLDAGIAIRWNTRLGVFTPVPQVVCIVVVSCRFCMA